MVNESPTTCADRISNQYVHELSADFDRRVDLLTLRSIFTKHKDPTNENSYLDYRAHPLLKLMKRRFPILSDNVSLFNVFEHRLWPIHVDTSTPGTNDRQCALNICVGGAAESLTAVTTFYDVERPSDFPMQYKLNAFDDSQAVEVFSFRMRRPLILNTMHPHRVVLDKGCSVRRMISWSIGVPYSEAVEFFKDV